MFCDGELQRSVRIPHGSENFSFCCCVTPIIIITSNNRRSESAFDVMRVFVLAKLVRN